MSDDEKIEIAKLWREVMDVWVRGFDYTKGYPRHLTDPYGRGIKDALGQLCPSLQQRPLDQRWSNPADTQSFLHDRDRPNAKEYQERLMEFYRSYPYKPEDLYKNEQQTKKAMTKFKKGDRVKCMNPNSVDYIKTGTCTTDVDKCNWVRIDGRIGETLYETKYLTIVDQPLSTTPDKVLQAAKTSPQAKDALKALFPDVFKDEPLTSRMGGGSRIFDGVFIGADGSYIIAEGDVEVRAKEQAYGTTTITFHKKP